MLDFLSDNIVRPILDRVSSTVGTIAGSVGATSGDIENINAALMVLVGLIFDLIVRKIKAS